MHPRSCSSVWGNRMSVIGVLRDYSAGEETETDICGNVDNGCDTPTDEGCVNDHDGYCDAVMQLAGNLPSGAQQG